MPANQCIGRQQFKKKWKINGTHTQRMKQRLPVYEQSYCNHVHNCDDHSLLDEIYCETSYKMK